MNSRQRALTGLSALILTIAAFACAEPSKPSAEAEPAASAAAPTPKPVEAAAPVPAAKPADMAAKKTSGATAPSVGMLLPVEADFEAEADAQITEKTYKSELDALEQA
ncbi:MAG: hypothetical protein AAFV29_18570, partial [Myxococcota bacterium]